MPEKRIGVSVNCQVNAGYAGECRGMPEKRIGVSVNCQVNAGYAGECRGMPEKRIGVSVNCQVNAGNAGECQGNIREWVYSATGMQGSTRGMQGSGCKVLTD